MALIFRCLDEDETTVLLSLTDGNDGSAVGFGIPPESFDLGGGELAATYLDDAAYDGGVQVFSSTPRTAIVCDLLLIGIDADDMRARLRLLATLLDRPRTVWEYRPDGASSSLYIDAMRSPKPRLLSGNGPEMGRVMNYYLGTPKLVINRQGWLRRAEMAAVAEATINNAPGGNTIQVYNPGSMRSPVRITIEPQDPDTSLVGVRVGRQSVGDLDEAASSLGGGSVDQATFPPGSDTTGTGAHADADAANGFVAETDFTSTNLLQRWEDTITPLEVTSLDGPRRVLFTGYAESGATYALQLRSGLTLPPSDVGQVVPLDLTAEDLPAVVRFDLDMGLASFDRFGDSLILQGWASCDTVGKVLSWDAYVLLPAAEALLAAREPSWLGVAANLTEYEPTALLVATHIDKPSTDAVDDGPAKSRDNTGLLDISDDGRVRMGGAAKVGSGNHPNRTDEGIGTAPNTGFMLPVGRYDVHAEVVVVNKDKNHQEHVQLRARNISHLEDRAVAAGWSESGIEEVALTLRAQFDVTVPTDLWQMQLVYTHDRVPTTGTPITHKVWIDGMALGAVRTIAVPEAVVLDGMAESSYGLVSSGRSHALTPAVPEAEPGWNLYVFHLEEVGEGGVSTDPVPAYWALREYRVSVDLAPRENPE